MTTPNQRPPTALAQPQQKVVNTKEQPNGKATTVTPSSAPAAQQAPKLQVFEYGGGKILELVKSVHVHSFLATLRGHEGRFASKLAAELWINSINAHQGFNEHGKKLSSKALASRDIRRVNVVETG